MAQDAVVGELAAAVAMRQLRRSVGRWLDVARSIIGFGNVTDAHAGPVKRKRCKRFR